VNYLAKLNIDQATARKIKPILSPDLNWAYFFERAKTGGVVSLTCDSLFKIDHVKSLVPEDIGRRFESCYYTVAARNTLLCQKLNTILSSFNQAGIEVSSLKAWL